MLYSTNVPYCMDGHKFRNTKITNCSIHDAEYVLNTRLNNTNTIQQLDPQVDIYTSNGSRALAYSNCFGQSLFE